MRAEETEMVIKQISENPTEKIEIRGIETLPLRVPFKTPYTMAAPYEQTRSHVDVLIVKINTNAGLYGIGETQAWRRQGSSEVLLNLVRVIKELFEPAMIGKSPLNINMIMQELNAIVYNSLYAQAAIGDALYDLAGKIFNVPLYELMGGKCRDSIEVGTDLGAFTSAKEMLNRAERSFERGYRFLRIKIGMDPKKEINYIKMLRKHFGDKIKLGIDASGSMHFEQALQFLKKVEDYDLCLAEQPVPIWDLDGMAALNRSITIPISADESVNSIHSLVEIIKKRAASIIQTKTGKNGGLYYCRKLWTIAEAADIAVYPGNHITTSVSAASVAHLCASWPSLRLAGDFQVGPCDIISMDVVKSSIVFKNGSIKVPQGPGLGMELDYDKINKLRVDK